MYISVIIFAITLILMIGLVVGAHFLGAVFPFLAQALSIFEMIILIGVLILAHEAGHFLMAEIFNIKVLRFAFGLPFGPILWKKNFKGVEIVIHTFTFLFGGYVAFADDAQELNLEADETDKIENRPANQRFSVYVAGVLANLICAFIFVFMAAAIWGQIPSGKYEVYVKSITAPQSESVWESGMQVGDKIIRVNGSEVNFPNTLVTYTQLSKRNDGKIFESTLENTYEKIKALNPAFTRDEVIPRDIIVKLPAKEDEPAFSLNDDTLMGFEKYKDERVELNDTQKTLRDNLENKSIAVSDGTYTLNDLAHALADGRCPVNITVLRNNEEINLKTIYPNESGLIGIVMDPKQVTIKTKNVGTIVKAGSGYLWYQAKTFSYAWYKLLTGKLPMDSVHGIIAIAKVGGDIIHTSGIFYGFLLTATISLYLAIFNILPIPALDGGHVMFLILEKIRGKKVNKETMEKLMSWFFIFLIGLIIVVSFNDIYALIVHKF